MPGKTRMFLSRRQPRNRTGVRIKVASPVVEALPAAGDRLCLRCLESLPLQFLVSEDKTGSVGTRSL